MLGLTVLSLVGHGQGAIRFNNVRSGAGGTTVNARFHDLDGTPLSGTGFSVQLWYGPASTPEGSLTGLASPILGFNTGAAAGYTSTAPTVQIPGVAIGGTATLMWRVWDNVGGTITNYAQAQRTPTLSRAARRLGSCESDRRATSGTRYRTLEKSWPLSSVGVLRAGHLRPQHRPGCVASRENEQCTLAEGVGVCLRAC